jgi:hypothetical protein
MDFFNGIGKKFTHAARTVQELTREGVEGSRLALDLRSARGELDRQLADLGRAYYEWITEGVSEVPEDLIARVGASMEHIESLMAQKERSRPHARCPGCGFVQAENARFCSNCGRRMPEDAPEPVAAEEDTEYCAECGAMRHGSSIYCSVCGHSFDPQEAQAHEPPAPIETPAIAEPLEEPEAYTREDN